MNLTKLFETQKILDQRIVEQHGLEGQDLLPQKILALQVELGECANEWRGFKFWSKDQEPRTEAYSHHEEKQHGRNGFSSIAKYEKNPLLEEYVDCLHFILSIGLELEIQTYSGYNPTPYIYGNDITRTFTHLKADASMVNSGFEEIEKEYVIYVNHFMHLGSMLGFDWEQIEQAYFAKNKINHTRQATGY